MKIYDLLFEMSNLSADKTGLPVNIWVSPGQSANFQHGPRLKVFRTNGKFNSREMASVQIKKDITIDDIIGYSKIPPKVFEKLRDFINVNYDALISFWFGKIDRKTLSSRIKRI